MSRVRTRPTRDETRDKLFEAAARVFEEQGIGGEFAPFQGLHGGGNRQEPVRQGQSDGFFPQVQAQKPLTRRDFQLFQGDDRHRMPLRLASRPPGC